MTKELISSDFFNNSALRLKSILENMVQRINNGSELGQEVMVVGNFCLDEFETIREMTNIIFEEWYENEKTTQETKIHDVIHEKNKEIEELRKKLDNLSNVSTASSSKSIRVYEEERRIAEENVRKKQEEALSIEVPEMITKNQVDIMLENVSKQLNDIKKEFQINAKDIQDYFNDIQNIFKCNTLALVSSLKGQMKRTLKEITSKYEEKTRYITEANEAKKKILNKMIEEIKKRNMETERKNELQKLVYNVYTSNPENPFIKSRSFISNNVHEIMNIQNLFERRNQVQDIYNKVSMFSGLFGREDLGVKVPIFLLNTIKLYLDKTERSRVLAYYGMGEFKNYRVKGCYNEEEGLDCPSYREHEVNGRTMEGNIPNAVEKLRSMTQCNIEAKTRLEEILNSTKVAENHLKIIWNHPPFYYGTSQLRYWENGQQIGLFYHEYGGRFWMIKQGFVGNFNGGSRIRHESGDARDIWNSQFISRYNAGVERIENAINQRMALLFDFETNPDSPFQMVYTKATNVNPLIIKFPLTELDILIKQCNELIKMIF